MKTKSEKSSSTKYYKQHRQHVVASGRLLTQLELRLIESKLISDVELSHIIDRSVQSIHVARTRISDNTYKNSNRIITL